MRCIVSDSGFHFAAGYLGFGTYGLVSSLRNLAVAAKPKLM